MRSFGKNKVRKLSHLDCTPFPLLYKHLNKPENNAKLETNHKLIKKCLK